MKHVFFIMACMLILPSAATAQPDNDELEAERILTKIVDMNNVEFQWEEFKEKTGKAFIKNDYIELEAKKDIVSTCTELPIDVQKDIFAVRLYMTPDKIDSKGYVGIVFDRADSENYKMFTLTKKTHELSYVKDGKIISKHKGLYKAFPYNPELDNDDDLKRNVNSGSNERNHAIQLPKTKDMFVFKIARRGNIVTFSVNGVELYKIKNLDMSNPTFGYVASEGHKLRGYGLVFTTIHPEEIDD